MNVLLNNTFSKYGYIEGRVKNYRCLKIKTDNGINHKCNEINVRKYFDALPLRSHTQVHELRGPLTAEMNILKLTPHFQHADS